MAALQYERLQKLGVPEAEEIAPCDVLVDALFGRITSYNVCYTKLLRGIARISRINSISLFFIHDFY